MVQVGEFSLEQQRSYDQFQAAFEAHNYWIPAEPIDGMQDVFLADLRVGLARVEACIARNAAAYGFRGLSRNALEALHMDLPNPCANVSSAQTFRKPQA